MYNTFFSQKTKFYYSCYKLVLSKHDFTNFFSHNSTLVNTVLKVHIILLYEVEVVCTVHAGSKERASL